MLIPKRKVVSGILTDESVEAAEIVATQEALEEIRIGYGTVSRIGEFTHRLKIPCGTDMYD